MLAITSGVRWLSCRLKGISAELARGSIAPTDPEDLGTATSRKPKGGPSTPVGIELRYEWNSELRVSQVFKTWEELEAAAAEKRRGLEARGWTVS